MLRIIVFLIGILWLCEPAWAYFQDAAMGVRPAGMAGAFTAVADDANAALYNPAGFTRLANLQLVGMYSDLYSGLNPSLYDNSVDRLGYNFIGLGIPLSPSIGALGAAWTQFSSSIYQENTLALSFGRSLWNQLSLGTTVKILHWGVVENDFTAGSASLFAETKKIGFTADLGALAFVWPGLDLGLTLENIIPADMGMFEKQIIPMIARMGVAYTLTFSDGYFDTWQPVVELSSRADVLRLKAGMETWMLHHVIALRLGVNNEHFTSGMSLCYALPQSPLALQVDYAFALPFQVENTFGSHRVGLTIGWNPKPEQKSEEAKRALTSPMTTPTMSEPIPEAPSKSAPKTRTRPLPTLKFAFGQSQVQPESVSTLEYWSKLLQAHPDWTLRIEGHACILGPDRYNQWLSEQRAKSVQHLLVDKYQVRPDQVEIIGYSNKRPIASNDTEAGRIQNRRVEIKILDQAGKIIEKYDQEEF